MSLATTGAYFAHAHTPNLDFFFANGGWLTFKGGDKLNVQRVIEKHKIGSGFFPKMLLFCDCKSVRIGQNIENKVNVSGGRSIFA